MMRPRSIVADVATIRTTKRFQEKGLEIRNQWMIFVLVTIRTVPPEKFPRCSIPFHIGFFFLIPYVRYIHSVRTKNIFYKSESRRALTSLKRESKNQSNRVPILTSLSCSMPHAACPSDFSSKRYGTVRYGMKRYSRWLYNDDFCGRVYPSRFQKHVEHLFLQAKASLPL